MRAQSASLARLLLWLTLVPTSLAAQPPGETADVHLRNDCRLAVQILTTGQPDPHRGWALETIPRCHEGGPPALASLWADAVEDPQALDELVLASSQLQDARILAAVEEAVGDEAQPVPVRIAGLRLLASYIDPAVRPSVEDLAPDPSTRFGLGIQLSHVVFQAGDEPLPLSAPWDILDFLQGLAASSASEEVRLAAGHIVRVCGRSGENPPRCR